MEQIVGIEQILFANGVFTRAVFKVQTALATRFEIREFDYFQNNYGVAIGKNTFEILQFATKVSPNQLYQLLGNIAEHLGDYDTELEATKNLMVV